MKNKIIRFIQLIFFFLFSGSVYAIVEIVYRGYTFPSMFILGGICGLFICLLNNVFTYEMDFILQILISILFCTFFEWVVGISINQNYTIWDYRNLIGNITPDCQINIFFSIAWGIISLIGIPILDYIDWRFFNYKKDVKPYYKILGKKLYLY